MKQKTGVFAVLTAALLLGSTMGLGCGGDDDTTGSGGTGGSGGSAGTGGGKGGTGGSTGGTSGTGGTGGTTDAGKGGTAGSDAGGGDAPATIPCGTSMCAPVMNVPILGTLPACCPGDTPNACGGTFPGGGCLTSTPGVADANCPMLTLMGFPLAGCCRPNGMCGVDLSGISLGCNDPTALGGMAGGACGGDAAPPPVDAARDTGTTDTGTTDTGTTDTGTTDTGTTDTGTTDTGTTDTGTTDTGTTDTGTTPDSAPGDAPAG